MLLVPSEEGSTGGIQQSDFEAFKLRDGPFGCLWHLLGSANELSRGHDSNVSKQVQVVTLPYAQRHGSIPWIRQILCRAKRLALDAG